MTWGVAASFVLYQFLLQTSTSVMLPDLMKAFSVDILTVSIITSSFFYPYLILQIPAGLLVDRFGPRRLLTVSIALCALASFIFSVAPNVSVAVSSRMMMGMVSAPAVATTLYIVSHWFPRRQFALIVGLTEMFGMLGGVLGERLLSECVSGWGWRGTMYGTAVVGGVLALLCWLLVRDQPPTDMVENNASSIPCATRSTWQHLRHVMGHGQVWLSGFYAGLMFVLIAAFASLWAVPFMEEVYGVSLIIAATASSFIFIGAALGAPLFGWLSDYLDKQRLPMIVSALLSLIVIACILYIPHIPLVLLYGLFFLLGLVSAGYVIAFAIVRNITDKETHGTAMGFTNMMCILIGAPVLQPLIGWLLEYNWQGQMVDAAVHYTTLDYQFALTSLPVCLVLALLLATLIRPH